MKNAPVIPTLTLLILGIAYLALVAAIFIFKLDLATDKLMQYLLHIDVLLTAIFYPLFAQTVYAAEADKTNGRLVLLFAGLFAVPVLIGRGIGIAAVSNEALFAFDGLLNFYAPGFSLSRSIELISWTVLYPLSMVYFAKLFFTKRDGTMLLGWLSLLSAICCFIAFLCFFSKSSIFLFIGILGWGVLFLWVVAAYLWRQIRKGRVAQG